MALHVTLVTDSLKNDGSLRPQVVQTDRVTLDDLLNFMAMDTALESTDMRAAITRFMKALVFYLSRGERVRTPFGSFALSARGTYVDGQTPRVETRNLGINFTPDAHLLYELRREAEVVMVDNDGPKRPVIHAVTNANDQSLPNQGRPGHLLMLRGSRFAFDPADQALGVFFVAGDGTATRARVYSRAGTTHVDCQVPELAEGPYVLEIRTRTPAGEIRTGSARALFMIVA